MSILLENVVMATITSPNLPTQRDPTNCARLKGGKSQKKTPSQINTNEAIINTQRPFLLVVSTKENISNVKQT